MGGGGVAWNGFSQLLPFSRAIPVNAIASVLAQSIFNELGLVGPDKAVAEEVQKQVDVSTSQGFTPMMTGHSLGGGLAKAIGAGMGVRTVVFSPVGMCYSAGRILEEWQFENLKEIVSIV